MRTSFVISSRAQRDERVDRINDIVENSFKFFKIRLWRISITISNIFSSNQLSVVSSWSSCSFLFSICISSLKSTGRKSSLGFKTRANHRRTSNFNSFFHLQFVILRVYSDDHRRMSRINYQPGKAREDDLKTDETNQKSERIGLNELSWKKSWGRLCSFKQFPVKSRISNDFNEPKPIGRELSLLCPNLRMRNCDNETIDFGNSWRNIEDIHIDWYDLDFTSRWLLVKFKVCRCVKFEMCNGSSRRMIFVVLGRTISSFQLTHQFVMC